MISIAIPTSEIQFFKKFLTCFPATAFVFLLISMVCLAPPDCLICTFNPRGRLNVPRRKGRKFQKRMKEIGGAPTLPISEVRIDYNCLFFRCQYVVAPVRSFFGIMHTHHQKCNARCTYSMLYIGNVHFVSKYSLFFILKCNEYILWQ